MQDLERGRFEQQWKDAFDGSEAVPSDSVWLSVESSIANAQNEKNKKRVVYYQRLAAALLILCVASVLVAYLVWDNQVPSEVAVNELKQESGDQHSKLKSRGNAVSIHDSTTAIVGGDKKSGMKPNVALGDEEYLSAKNTESSFDKNQNGVGKSNANARFTAASAGKLNSATGGSEGNELQNLKSVKESNLIAGEESARGRNNSSDSINTMAIDNPLLLSENSVNEKSITSQTLQSKPLTEAEEQALVKKMLADAGVVTEQPEEKKIIISHPAWLSVGFAGGNYSQSGSSPSMIQSQTYVASSISGMNSAMANTSFAPAPKKPSPEGTAYSIGLMVGKAIAPRWIVQSGFTYLNRGFDYNSNIVGQSPDGTQVFIPSVAAPDNTKSYGYASEYSIRSTTEFISIPLQLGFVVIDRKFGLILNSGAAADIFLRSTLTDQSGIYKSVSQSSGENSLYRNVSWSGLANVEATWKITNHYRLSLVPGMRYSISNIMKEGTTVYQPLVVDIGFRFRYDF